MLLLSWQHLCLNHHYSSLSILPVYLGGSYNYIEANTVTNVLNARLLAQKSPKKSTNTVALHQRNLAFGTKMQNPAYHLA